MPPDFSYQQKRKLGTDARVYIWDDPLLFTEGQIRSLEDVCQKMRKVELLISVMHHQMDDTLKETEHPRKFSNQVFISLPYSETILNGLSSVIDVREL